MFAQAGLDVGARREKEGMHFPQSCGSFSAPCLGNASFDACGLFSKLAISSGEFLTAHIALPVILPLLPERLAPANFAVLPFVASYMELGGLSSSLRTRPLLQAERRRVLAECVLPRAAEIVQACIETLDETADPMAAVR